MHKLLKVVANRLIRLTGNVFKLLGYPFHFLLPEVRFTIPEYSAAKIKRSGKNIIPRVIWQTNFTNKVTLPVYLNYLFNRLMSLSCDYHYVSTEARDEFFRQHAAPEVCTAYFQLNDGAAQADLWRLLALTTYGGVYMDIDATLVWSLHSLLGTQKELYIEIKKNKEITNYFIASVSSNLNLQTAIEQVVLNINNYSVGGVYQTTGPAVLNQVLMGKDVNTKERKYVCIQGAFTNEYFQYRDKPRGKWIHTDPKDLVKK